MEIRYDRACDVNDIAFWEAVTRLRNEVWPPPEPMPVGERAVLIRERGQTDDSEVFTIWQDEQAIAHARLFGREIITPQGPLLVAALAAVCVLPQLQGKGVGRRIVEEAFSRVDGKTYSVCLFQTGVPGFYEKLGARLVENRFFDSTNSQAPDANPWQPASQIMIYPAPFVWPEGPIDLRGYGY